MIFITQKKTVRQIIIQVHYPYMVTPTKINSRLPIPLLIATHAPKPSIGMLLKGRMVTISSNHL